jgi:hypothetical protein
MATDTSAVYTAVYGRAHAVKQPVYTSGRGQVLGICASESEVQIMRSQGNRRFVTCMQLA